MPAPPIQQQPTFDSLARAYLYYGWQRWKRRLLLGLVGLGWTLLVIGVTGGIAWEMGYRAGHLLCLP